MNALYLVIKEKNTVDLESLSLETLSLTTILENIDVFPSKKSFIMLEQFPVSPRHRQCHCLTTHCIRDLHEV
jgi:hypothetical protein